jgi:hypothetical protein
VPRRHVRHAGPVRARQLGMPNVSHAGSKAGAAAALLVGMCAFGIAFAAPPAVKCPDSADKCLKPVKFITKGTCFVYACQYGTPKVRLINVDASKKAALDKLASEDRK